jgi:LacI family transcriptional regulator
VHDPCCPAGSFDVVVKLADVARLAGVGVGTASRAISGRGSIDPETKERVLAAAAQLGYRPNAAARALRERRTRVVGLLLPDIHNEFYTASVAVLQNVLDGAGFQLLVAATGNDPKSEQDAIAAMLDRQVDGLVHVPVDDTAPLPADLPIVQLNRRSEPLQAPAVVSDDVAGVAHLTGRIIRAGHTDVAVVVGPPEHSTSRDRLAGFRQAVAAAGIPEGSARTPAGRSRTIVRPFTTAGGADAVATLAEDPPQTLIALSSRLMLGVVGECARRGIRVPDELSVAGLGDPEWYPLWQPSITTFAPPLAEMGRRAAQILLGLLADPAAPRAATHILVPGEVRIRGSVAGLPAPVAPSARLTVRARP